MRICYFGGYDPNHPRNWVLIEGLRRCGAEVRECHSRHPLKVIRPLSLMLQYARLWRRTDVVVVGACGHGYVPLAWALCRLTRKPLVFDAFVSLFEIWSEESGEERPVGIRGRGAFLLDRIAARLADRVLLDTEEHAAFFRQAFGFPEEKVRSVPVGSEMDRSGPRGERSPGGPFRVLFVGSFLPLHGIEVILNAADRLTTEDGLRMELYGDWAGRRRGKRYGQVSGARVSVEGPIPRERYVELLAHADAALGAFGDTPKAGRVIPCKVYDALAAGVPLITGDTPAVRRILRDGQNAMLVRPGDAEALAEGIRRLKRDPFLRQKLAQEGRRTFEQTATPEKIGLRLLDLCGQLMEEKR